MKDLSDLILYKASAGSGKTYTLAKEYLKLVILNPYDYNKILAVTFWLATSSVIYVLKWFTVHPYFKIAHNLNNSLRFRWVSEWPSSIFDLHALDGEAPPHEREKARSSSFRYR